MVAIVKKSTTPLCKLATSKVLVVTSLLILFLIVSWQQIPTLLPYISTNRYDAEIERYNFQDDINVLNRAINKLRGDDFRLVQWDATKHTQKYQKKICPSTLPTAVTNLIDITWILQQLSTKQQQQQQQQQSATSILQILQASLEICILCITDNPTNREIFSVGKEQDHRTQDDNDNLNPSTLSIYDAVVTLLRFPSLTPYAAHLIYIASFANRNNYHGFVDANAVETLSDILVSWSENDTAPYTYMWVAAALQNLAASYCTTPDDGRCYWEWKKRETLPDSNRNEKQARKENVAEKSVDYVLQLSTDSGKMVIDGTTVRQKIASTPHIMDRLVQHACSGPVHEKMSKKYPYPGHNAVHGNSHEGINHELSPTIVPWATTGVLKNLMLDTSIRTAFLQQYDWSMSCFCYMSKSRDWLEANKGEGALQHLRIDSDPCWFNFQGTKKNKKLSRKKAKTKKVLCIDRIFVDNKGNTCEAYNDEELLTKDDCATLSTINTEVAASASDACCPCGGGDNYTGPGQVET
jgi:hypothetical protein